MIACTKAPSLCLTTAKAFSFEANPNIRVAQKASKLVSSKMQHNTKRHGFENHPASGPPSQAFLTTHRFALFLLGFTFVDATCMCAFRSTKSKERNRHAECARSVPPCRPVPQQHAHNNSMFNCSCRVAQQAGRIYVPTEQHHPGPKHQKQISNSPLKPTRTSALPKKQANWCLQKCNTTPKGTVSNTTRQASRIFVPTDQHHPGPKHQYQISNSNFDI